MGPMRVLCAGHLQNAEAVPVLKSLPFLNRILVIYQDLVLLMGSSSTVFYQDYFDQRKTGIGFLKGKIGELSPVANCVMCQMR